MSPLAPALPRSSCAAAAAPPAVGASCRTTRVAPHHRHYIHHQQQQHQQQQLPPRSVVAAAGKRQQQKPQKPRRRKKQPPQLPIADRIFIEEDDDDDAFSPAGPASVILVPNKAVPRAPPPASSPASDAGAVGGGRPEQQYAVFPKPQPAVERLRDSKWSWGDDEPRQASSEAQPERLWNPRTGFMRTRAEAEREEAAAAARQAAAAAQAGAGGAAAAAGAAASSSNSGSGSASGSSISSSSSSSSLVEPLPPEQPALQPPPLPAAAAAAPGQLAAVSREQVLGSCLATSAGMAAAALALRLFAGQQAAALLGTSQDAIDRLLQLPPGLADPQQAGLLLGLVGAVTGARLALLRVWPAFAAASERSNRQVLAPLGWPDVAAVALLSGVSEELLFRGALIPATWPDARGVALSGLVFGLLHVTGGRNAATAAWAGAVGGLYGAAFVASGNVWVPAGAHVLANFAAAAAWRLQQQRGDAGA